MTKLIRHISLLFFIVCSLTVFSQKELDIKSYRGQKQNASMLLEEAKSSKSKTKALSIKQVEQAIQLAKREKDWRTEGEAYFFLGNIYEDIGQNELALQRYQQALKILSYSKEISSTDRIHQRMGQIYLELKNEKGAEVSFKRCIELSRNEAIKIKCEEGLADVELLRGDVDASFEKLDYVQTNFSLDSISNARVEARRSQGYLQNNDYSNASQSYINSINNIPKETTLEKEDILPIEKAKEDLLNFSDANTIEKISFTQNSVQSIQSQTNLNDILVAENLRIAELYVSENEFSEANNFVSISKNSISESTDASIAAEVYKKSYELNLKSGQTDAAYKDLEKYIALKEAALDSLKIDLNQQLEIVKNQNNIDQWQSDYDLAQKDRALMESQLTTQKIVIGLLSLLLIASLIFFYFLFKNIKAKRRANQRLLLRSLRTQMNPHFIFNALNSVNNFIAKNDEKSANKFLSDFSRLMRKVLDYSKEEFISFDEELELNELYLKLEHFRFRDKFEYELVNNLKNKEVDLMVPPMLIQPFIENAVWHGLRYKEDMGKLSVIINEEKDNIVVSIQDDGIGRKQSKALKTKNQKAYKSTGLENVNKRISLINEIYDKKYDIEVSDVNSLAEETGTLVRVKIPLS